MKRLLLPICVMLMCMTSCQKEDAVVLTALIEDYHGNGAKMYVDDYNYACWESGDPVRINNGTYSIAVSEEGKATLTDVTAAEEYYAVFPAGIVRGTFSSSSTSIELPVDQTYQTRDDHQVLAAPMAAYTHGNTLRFRNLGSLMQVNVDCNNNQELYVSRIEVTASNAVLSGTGTLTGITGEAPQISMDNTGGYQSVTLLCNRSFVGGNSYYISIPPVSNSSNRFTIKVYTKEGEEGEQKYVYTREQGVGATGTVGRNSIVIVDFDISEDIRSESTSDVANLKSGQDFNAAIKTLANGSNQTCSDDDNLIKSIVINYNSIVTTSTIVSKADSPLRVYAGWDATLQTLNLYTAANQINADANAKAMFKGLKSLVSLDLTGINTASVTDMSAMFEGCESLENLNLSSFSTASVTDMSAMFKGCQELGSLDLTGFNTANVTNMSAMFEDCQMLGGLNLSGFSTANVTDMSTMFKGCQGLNTLILKHEEHTEINTASVTDMSAMFEGCQGLGSLDLTVFNTASVTDMSAMFKGCQELESLDLYSFNTGNVTDMSAMFEGCQGLGSLDISSFSTRNVTDMSAMFKGCQGLGSLVFYIFDTGNVTDMSSMFEGCESLENLDLSRFDTRIVTNMSYMFCNCKNMRELTLGVNFYVPLTKEKMFLNFASESRNCTIYCTQSTYEQLFDGTYLNGDYVRQGD